MSLSRARYLNPRLTRRAFAAGSAAVLAAPGVLAQTSAQSGALAALAERARGLEQLHSIVLLHRGEPVLAEAVRGPALNRAVNVKSVSKTILATLTGIAIDRGVIAGPDQPVAELLPRREVPAGLTVDHLLSMRSGLESTSGPNYGAWVSSRDWVGFVLDRPSVDRPGGRFIYSTGGWHVLGAALSEVTGLSLLQMARDWIGAPLGIGFAPWVRDPQGLYLGGNEMAMSPPDLARFGEMIRRGGAWDGQQVVSARWIDTSFRPRARSPWSGDRYGYGWFLTRLGGAEMAYGRGYGGQMLAVMPGREAVLAITSDPTRPARSGGYFGELRGLAGQAAEVLAGRG